MTDRFAGSLAREAALSAAAAAALASVLLWAGPHGTDFAAHAYQRVLFLQHGFLLWNNFWYAGRYSFVTYSVVYYPLAAFFGIKVLALASVATASLAFAVVLGREWGPTARFSSRTFAVVWAGIVLSAAFPFALGAALALLAIWALQAGKRWRFGVLALLTLGASPLAFVLLAVLLAGIGLARQGRPVLVPGLVMGGISLAELLILRIFPSGGRFPYPTLSLLPPLAFCGLGALVVRRGDRARPLMWIFLVLLAACVAAYTVPSSVGSNIGRFRYAALPLAVLALSLARWRPLKLALPLLAIGLAWNVTPLATNWARADDDPAASRAYWQPAIAFLHGHLGRSFRVEAVDTLGHWPAMYLAEARIPLVRGWYRQDDFPQNELLYGRFAPRAYQAWLRRLGVRYVILAAAPPDYSSRAEAALLAGGRSGLRAVLRTPTTTIFAVPRPRPLVTGPARASVERLGASRILLRVAAPGRYRVAVRFSPYWRTLAGCVARGHDGMIVLTAVRAGIVDLDFKLDVHRALEALTGTEPTRFCGA